MRSADPAARELLASVDAGRCEVLWRLRLPSALPSIFTAARFNVGLGWPPRTSAKVAASPRAASGRPAAGPPSSNADVLWTTILCTALLGVLGARSPLSIIERVLLRWHVSQRS